MVCEKITTPAGNLVIQTCDECGARGLRCDTLWGEVQVEDQSLVSITPTLIDAVLEILVVNERGEILCDQCATS